MAYRHQSAFLRQLKVNDPKDIRKDMSLYTYVIELPGVKEEDVKIRVTEGNFLIIEAQGFKEDVSPFEAEMESLRKWSREMREETERIHQEAIEEIKRRVQEQGRKCEERIKHLREMERLKKRSREMMEETERNHQKTLEEIKRRVQEQDRKNKKRMKRHFKEMKKEIWKMKLHVELDELEELNRMSQQQATLFGNMAGYPFLHPGSYHVASTSQQAYYSNNTYHLFPAVVDDSGMDYKFPQFNFSVPSSSFPPAAPIPFGHRGFAGSANLPGMFSLNPSATPASSTTGYDNVINSGVWIHGSPGSSTGLAIPASTYYSFQNQSQGQVQGPQHSQFQQGQQQQQYYGNLGYPNFYSSQTGISQEHQQQQTHNNGSLRSTI